MEPLNFAVATLDDIASLRETDEVEVKLANGQNGRGELPKDFWPTYSAFANAGGGYIVLGLREGSNGFSVEGIPDVERLRTQLFDQLGNRQKVSTNLLSEDDVITVSIDGKAVIIAHVSPASRRHRPVFINGNPMTGTYRRVHSGDRVCDAESVKRMLAEQTEDSRDDRVLHGFTLSDLNAESVDVYRRMLRDSAPYHPFLELKNQEFLQRIRAWRTDRDTGRDGLTVAGLLMFGTSEAIRDEFPNYALDYQERDEPRAERWVDRLTTDGTWSGNLFDFYRQVWRKLTVGLKAPFRLIDGQRHDETSAHTALREALVNSLVHADFTGRASILIVRRPDMFGFRNPGLMRVPVELAVRGGESDGRNRTLQQMFLLIGAGERAGSGVPKIHKGWREQHWRPPALYERHDPSEQTLLELRMEDLLPKEVTDALREQFGDRFEELSPEERVVLATAALEMTVSHARAMTLCEMHAVDMTRLLQRLVQDGYLVKVGQGRGTKYHLPGAVLADPNDAFAAPIRALPSDLSSKPSELAPQSSDLSGETPKIAPYLGREVAGLEMLLIDDLDAIDQSLLKGLETTASTLGGVRVPKEEMEHAILALCQNNYLTLKVLARLLARSEDYLRQGYLNPMAKAERLKLAFPQAPNDPRQAYTSTNVR